MNSKVLMVLGGGVLLYYVFGKQSAAAPTTTPTSGTTAAGATPPAPSPAGTVAATPQSPSQRATIVNYINGSGVSSTFVYGQQTPDTWNWYAMQANPGWTAPDPQLLYPGEPNVHTKTYTFDDWFKRVQPYLPGSAASSLQGYTPSRWYAVGPGGWMA